MFCKECEILILDNSKFCSECGKPQSKQESIHDEITNLLNSIPIHFFVLILLIALGLLAWILINPNGLNW